ncbi:hypothetical protein DTO166G4_3672 [Paecilomyces variotii]|uniref:Kinesin family protein n=1 Tax=Byssochlamys spectabilis TaxID=264951 RepID=A0A443HLT3_BYSSP|nr:kinesin family protein [Paecilomyces variotii]KAJ9197871.1 hypothetical protein DTO164E3_5427 [Paecilomyces variotii]KAJ9214840.1 hypothetical protein DTO166G4_3672 [Paecilomyces variotii]KAJ9222865.1 hypothetical protein DTO169C6_4714 [Paecilomyces variotii]KAJ9237508.1 hypothetical protein DTO166G5_3598 [Paecilomyces variotii]KAJ9243286.1 hypothetical protein DTO169E5_2868 [Paecilomyces variotii]
MSVRVVARVRPLLKSERELDVIVRTGPSPNSTASLPSSDTTAKSGAAKGKKDALAALRDRDTIVRIPNPKNEGEEFSFQFNAVYDASATQQELFDAEVAPTVKHLFTGFDVTIFAYGVTGTGKTHTMRGGKSLADRGVIPRLLSAIYRRSRKLDKDSEGQTKVDVSMSYYEIYNDKVFDLFEPPEKRTASGLPLRDNGGKTVVVGLTERPCPSLKEFESLYDQANMNRSTSATKLNAHSSRSHAILCVKVAVTTGDKTRISTASAIDLAGSEDNRRTGNDKERMVESASINKSLFVLAQCVEAISKKQPRIPYRESKMTRILSLGQNNGLTVMILNLAPVRSYHLDTVSSLNFANRTKKVEVREVENEPMFKGPPRPTVRSSVAGSMQRQPLRPLAASVNANIGAPAAATDEKPADSKPAKAFFVYSDKPQQKQASQIKKPEITKRSSPLKRKSDTFRSPRPRTAKGLRQPELSESSRSSGAEISAAKIEEMVQKKVEEILAAKALDETAKQKTQANDISEAVQRRLELLEQRIEGREDARAEGLSYLLMAKQHHARGEDSSALKMYQLALPFFPHNAKLLGKISTLQEKLDMKVQMQHATVAAEEATSAARRELGSMLSLKKNEKPTRPKRPAEVDGEYQDSEHNEEFSDEEYDLAGGFRHKPKQKRAKTKSPVVKEHDESEAAVLEEFANSPRTAHLLSIINSRDVSQIKLLKGVGIKKAEAIVDCLCEMDHELDQDDYEASDGQAQVKSLTELSKMKGVGLRTVQNMRSGIVA